MLSMQIQYTNMLSIVHYYRRLHLSVIYMYHCICMTRNKIQSHICQNDAQSNIFFGLTYFHYKPMGNKSNIIIPNYYLD